ncbi:hypothetical protein ACI8AF_22625 [Blastococcus sp. SYSU D00669]
MIVTCPACFSADEVSYQRLPDKLLAYYCTGRHADGEPHEWVGSAAAARESWAAPEGVTDDLLEPLLGCIDAGDGLLEYGIVEYRLRARYPDLFRTHVAERGHTLLGHTQTTASAVRFGVALGRLARSGDLAFEWGPATGAWSYNGRISYWCHPPAAGRSKVTWTEFCGSIGRPAEWTDEDREAVKPS